jgi:electron transport complex protein RnfE
LSSVSYKTLTHNGLWKNNPALVQLLGLCPLLAVSASVVNSLGLAVATLFAAAVTAIELLMQAYAYELYQILGIFLPLITTNCVILGRADAFAAKNPVLPSVYDGFIMGLGFGLVLVALGAIRELLGTGGLFANMQLLFGEQARAWHWVISEDYPKLLLAILPPGAFIVTGFLIAGKNQWDEQARQRAARAAAPVVAGSKRVRVTGKIS